MEDLALWKNIKQGNKTALKHLHTKYFYQMCLYAYKSVNGDTGLAKDLVSGCFIKLWESRKKIDITTSIKQYLFLMLRNSIVDHYRSKKIITEPLSGDYIDPGGEKDFDDQKKYAPKETIISGKFIDGEMTDLKIVPENRKEDLIVYSTDSFPINK